MKDRAVIIWRCIFVILWLLSLQAIIRAGFQPCCFGSASVERPDPWITITLLSIVTTIQCLLIYFIWQPPKSLWSPLRLGAVFGVFLILSIAAVFTLLMTDLPLSFYVTSEFTLLLTLIFLLLLSIAAVFSLGKRFFNLWRMAGNK